MTKDQRAFAKLVGDYLDGNLAASKALSEIRRGHIDPDHLYHSTVFTCRPELACDFIRGVLRAVQKRLEQEVRNA